MKQMLIGLGVGLLAGIIDIIPMIIKKLDKMFILSAITMWIVVGFIASVVEIIPWGWLNGMIIALILFIPISFLIYRVDKGAMLQVAVTVIVLGSTVGALSKLLMK